MGGGASFVTDRLLLVAHGGGRVSGEIRESESVTEQLREKDVHFAYGGS